MHRLYIVTVPCGHVDDMTLRAERVLRQAALIVVGCRRVLEEGVSELPPATPVLVREGQASAHVARTVLEALRMGDVAWVSTGNAPSTDEQALLGALPAQGVEILPVPGPWDAVACLAVSGLPADRFSFMGELGPAPKQRRAALQAAVDEHQTLIWRLPSDNADAALHEAAAILGARRCALCSLAGVHEVWRGRLGEGAAPVPAGGYLVVEGSSEAPAWPAERVRERVRALLARGVSVRDASRSVALQSGWRRKQVYQVAVELSSKPDGS
ncbi:MAG: hypothetical protein JXA09_05270 [Anaerolineae bacterium]|nr:hypothetical protein [Anaerolineae bacterium]